MCSFSRILGKTSLVFSSLSISFIALYLFNSETITQSHEKRTAPFSVSNDGKIMNESFTGEVRVQRKNFPHRSLATRFKDSIMETSDNFVEKLMPDQTNHPEREMLASTVNNNLQSRFLNEKMFNNTPADQPNLEHFSIGANKTEEFVFLEEIPENSSVEEQPISMGETQMQTVSFHGKLEGIPRWEENWQWQFPFEVCSYGKPIQYNYQMLKSHIDSVAVQNNHFKMYPSIGSVPNCVLNHDGRPNGETKVIYDRMASANQTNFAIMSENICDGVGASILRQFRGYFLSKALGSGYVFRLPYCGTRSTLNYQGVYCHLSGQGKGDQYFKAKGGHSTQKGQNPVAPHKKGRHRRLRGGGPGKFQQAYFCFNEDTKRWFPFEKEIQWSRHTHILCSLHFKTGLDFGSNYLSAGVDEGVKELREMYIRNAQQTNAPTCGYAGENTIHVAVHLRRGDISKEGRGKSQELSETVYLMQSVKETLNLVVSNQTIRFHIFSESSAIFTGHFAYFEDTFQFFRIHDECTPTHFMAKIKNQKQHHLIGPVHFVLNNSPFHAIHCLSLADILILAPSNFSWLAAALSNPNFLKIFPGNIKKSYRSSKSSLGARVAEMFLSLKSLNFVSANHFHRPNRAASTLKPQLQAFLTEKNLNMMQPDMII